MTKRKALLFWGCVALVTVVVLIAQQIVQTGSGLTVLSTGWDMETMSGISHNVDLSDLDAYADVSPGRGEQIMLSHLIPALYGGDDAPAASPALLLVTDRSAVSVSMDGVVLYEEDGESVQNNSQMLDRPHFISLPADYAGKLVTITVTPAGGKTLNRIQAPVAGDYETLIRMLDHRMLVSFTAGVFMALFGLLSLLLMTVFFIRLRRIEMRMAVALLTADSGLFLILSSMIQAHVTDAALTGWTQVFRFLFVPLLFAFLALVKRRLPKKLFLIIAISASACSLLLLLLLLSDGSRVVWVQTLYTLMLSGTTLLMIYDAYGTFVTDRDFSEHALQIMTVTALCLTVLAESVASCLRLYLGTDRSVLMRALIPFPVALYFVSQMLHDSMFLKNSFLKRDENEMLYKIAYEDALTGLSNRTAWDEKIHEVDESKHSWCIVSIDLDGLKGINDTKGHAAGDQLISGFARALEESFGRDYFLSRIGGDEFCVIMEEADAGEVRRCFEKLESRLAALDKKEKHINHRCSYGYAFYVPGEKDAHATYLEADMAMYQMKSMHKAAKKANAMTQRDSADVRVAQMVEETIAKMRQEELLQGKPVTMSPTEALLEMAKQTFAEEENETAEEQKERSFRDQPLKGAQTKSVPPASARKAPKLRTPLSALRAPKTEDAVKAIREAEIKQAAKDVAVKKALKTLEEAQQASQENAPSGKGGA